MLSKDIIARAKETPPLKEPVEDVHAALVRQAHIVFGFGNWGWTIQQSGSRSHVGPEKGEFYTVTVQVRVAEAHPQTGMGVCEVKEDTIAAHIFAQTRSVDLALLDALQCFGKAFAFKISDIDGGHEKRAEILRLSSRNGAAKAKIVPLPTVAGEEDEEEPGSDMPDLDAAPQMAPDEDIPEGDHPTPGGDVRVAELALRIEHMRGLGEADAVKAYYKKEYGAYPKDSPPRTLLHDAAEARLDELGGKGIDWEGLLAGLSDAFSEGKE